MLEELKARKWLVWILVAVGEIALLLLVFRVGEVIGVDRANFNAAWSQNYGRMFGDPRPGGFFESFGSLPPPVSAFGNAGTVLSVAGGNIIIKDNHNNEKTVAISSSTTIREGTQNIALKYIQAGAGIVIIGAPNGQGQIEARFVRIFPDEPEVTSTGQ